MADIPIDLICEIMCRCPVKSVLRFKTVSPEWLALILSPDFKDHYFRHSRASVLAHVCSHQQPLNETVYSYGIRGVDPHANFHFFDDFPGIDRSTADRLSFIGSPNGVVCVVRHSDVQDFTLWNPITRSRRPLPAPTLIFNLVTHTRICVGMGFNPASGDYKIVRLLERRINEFDDVEVLSVNRGGWTVSTTHERRMNMTDAPCVVANGVPYWIGIKEVPESKNPFIEQKLKKRRSLEEAEGACRLVWFDVVNEMFHTEEFAWEAESSRTMLGVREDFLCAVAWDDLLMDHFDLWVKVGDVWNRTHARVETPPFYWLVPWFLGDIGLVYKEEVTDEGMEEVSYITYDPTGVEDVGDITPLEGLQVTDCVRVLGWADGFTEIPRLGHANAN